MLIFFILFFIYTLCILSLQEFSYISVVVVCLSINIKQRKILCLMRFSGGNQQKQIEFCIYVKKYKTATYYDDFYVIE